MRRPAVLVVSSVACVAYACAGIAAVARADDPTIGRGGGLGAGLPPVETGRVTGRIAVRRGGAPVPADGVIVYVVGFAEPAPAGIRPIEIHQRDKTFVPDLVAVTAGESVSFPNDDPFFHNVFSPSPARQFDLGSYPRGDTKVKTFPSVGVVEVYCNIHPQMAASVLVLPNQRFARPTTDGIFALEGVPVGHWTLYAYSRRALRPVSAPLEVTAGAIARVDLAIDETREGFEHPTKYGEPYRDPAKYRP